MFVEALKLVLERRKKEKELGEVDLPHHKSLLQEVVDEVNGRIADGDWTANAWELEVLSLLEEYLEIGGE